MELIQEYTGLFSYNPNLQDLSIAPHREQACLSPRATLTSQTRGTTSAEETLRSADISRAAPHIGFVKEWGNAKQNGSTKAATELYTFSYCDDDRPA